MNAPTFDMTPALDEATLLRRAQRGDLHACAALLDAVAPDIYSAVLLDAGDAGVAHRITEAALLNVAEPLSRGDIASAGELRWQIMQRARRDVGAINERKQRLAGTRAGIRHLFGLAAATGLVVYATTLAM